MIKFLRLKGHMPAQIKPEMDAIYRNSTPLFATVKRPWAAEFKRNHTSLVDDKRSERSTTATITDRKSLPNGTEWPLNQG